MTSPTELVVSPKELVIRINYDEAVQMCSLVAEKDRCVA